LPLPAVRRRRGVNGNLVVITHGLVCRAVVERHTKVPTGAIVPDRFDNTSITVLHEDAPHAVSLLNCTQHLTASAELDRTGGPA